MTPPISHINQNSTKPNTQKKNLLPFANKKAAEAPKPKRKPKAPVDKKAIVAPKPKTKLTKHTNI